MTILIKVVTLDNGEEWDSIVTSFEEYDTFYMSGYVKALQIHGDGEPLLIHYRDDMTHAINVVIKRKIDIDLKDGKQYYDFATPYNYGGLLVEGEVSEQFEEEYSKLCHEMGIVSEFVRFHPIIDNVRWNKNLYETVNLGKYIALDTTSEELIWTNLDTKRRNNIRKAQKNGVEIGFGMSEELIHQFETLYYETMDKDHAIDYYYFEDNYFQTLYREFSEHTMLFYATYESNIIAMCYLLLADGKITCYLSAAVKHMELNPVPYMYYEAACWGARNGYRYFSLGGGLGYKEDNLYRFKKLFNKNSNFDFIIGKRCYDENTYQKLVEAHKKGREDWDDNSLYFPLYRA